MNKTVPVTAGKDIGPAHSDMAESRCSVYRLFSALLIKEVDPGMLAALKGDGIAGALGELAPGIRNILDSDEPEKQLGELAQEYAALFIVPGGIPPYESVRLHGLMNQKPSWEVEEFYRHCGLAIKEECRMLPDHLGMELEFMGYLAEKEGDAQRRRDEKESAKWSGFQQEFFRGHIDPWAFDFLRDLQRVTFHPFYKGIGSLIVQFLDTEKEYFGSLQGSSVNGSPQTKSAEFLDRREDNHER
jgi:putative dimethyl sulfoxide reductase chaperone